MTKVLWRYIFAAIYLFVIFIPTSILLSRQKTCFVATKIILVAAPANNRKIPCLIGDLELRIAPGSVLRLRQYCAWLFSPTFYQLSYRAVLIDVTTQ